MGIELSDTFDVDAPVEQVWNFLLNPDKLASCMPGARLGSRTEDGAWQGEVSLRIGAISVRYGGKLTYTRADADERLAVMAVTADEQSGGQVSGTIEAKLEALSAERSRAVVKSSFEMTGRLVQVGRGMIEGAAKQIIGRFVANVKSSLERESAATSASPPVPVGESMPTESAATPPAPVKDEESIDVLSLIWQMIQARWRALVAGLFGRRR